MRQTAATFWSKKQALLKLAKILATMSDYRQRLSSRILLRESKSSSLTWDTVRYSKCKVDRQICTSGAILAHRCTITTTSWHSRLLMRTLREVLPLKMSYQELSITKGWKMLRANLLWTMRLRERPMEATKEVTKRAQKPSHRWYISKAQHYETPITHA